MSKEVLLAAAAATDTERLCKQLRDRQRVQEWLKLRELPSECFAEGFVSAIGGAVLVLGARGQLDSTALLTGSRLNAAVGAAVTVFTEEYVRLVGSVYR